MKKIFTPLLLLISIITYSQSNRLKLVNAEKRKTTFIKEGNKVLMAVKMPRYQSKKKPSNVYLHSKLELADSVYVFTKGRIKTIGDTSIIMRERNSFFSASNREIRIDRINTLRKLTTGNQIFRTATTVGGALAFGVVILYSYVTPGTQGNGEFIRGMFYAAGTGAFLTRFGRTKISKKQLNNWKMEIVPVP
jgi:hypothetical protein